MFFRLLIATCLIGAVVIVGLARPKRLKYIPDGVWGTEHMVIRVENGAAAIEYDCAHGTINGPLKIDSKGRFSLRGTHVRERPGPMRIDQPPLDRPARYTGWTDGRKMTLKVTLEDGKKETVGNFELKRGQPGRLFKCN
jgi:hypothetical protein